MASATAITFAATALSSCELETSQAGAFDGMWHLMRIDTIATGGTLDLSKERIYWSFQYKLMEADDKTGGHRSIIMRYAKGNGKLRLSSPYAYNREEGDEPLSEPSLLAPFGINKIEEEYQVIKLNGSTMQLQSDVLMLRFKKF